MNQEKLSGHDREAPHSHLIQAMSPLIFMIIIILDSFFFQWSTFLNEFIPFWVRVLMLIVFLGFAITLIQLSHKALFQENNPSDELVTNGILKLVRNPMYLGILLIYVSFILFSLSLISVVAFIIIVILYNRMVNFEEHILEQLFGEKYLEYKKRVPKWIPKLF